MQRLSNKKRELSRKEELFLPWLLTNEIRLQVNKILPRAYHFRMRLYFERYGCISCHQKRRQYGANGLCRCCSDVIRDRLHTTDAKLRRQFQRENDGAAKLFLRRLESARRILADIKAIMG